MRHLVRPIEPGDFRVCRRIIDLSMFTPSEVDRMESAWRSLIPRDELIGVVVEDLDAPDNERIILLGTFVFASDDWMRKLKKRRRPGDLTRLLLHAGSPRGELLDRTNIGLNAAQGGLNAVSPLGYVRLFDQKERFEKAVPLILSAFQETLAGFQIREFLGEAHSMADVEWLTQGGNWHLRSRPKPSTAGGTYLMGATKAECPENSIMWCVLNAPKPVLRVPEEYKQVLALARAGYSDAAICTQLGVPQYFVHASLNAVYEIHAKHVGAEPNVSADRERLVAFLRRHPEEIRPWIEHPAVPRHLSPVFAPPQPSGTAPNIFEQRMKEFKLTDKEMEVMRWVKKGKTDAEIAEIMSRSIKTIQQHLQNSYRKVNANSRTSALFRLSS